MNMEEIFIQHGDSRSPLIPPSSPRVLSGNFLLFFLFFHQVQTTPACSCSCLLLFCQGKHVGASRHLSPSAIKLHDLGDDAEGRQRKPPGVCVRVCAEHANAAAVLCDTELECRETVRLRLRPPLYLLTPGVDALKLLMGTAPPR